MVVTKRQQKDTKRQQQKDTKRQQQKDTKRQQQKDTRQLSNLTLGPASDVQGSPVEFPDGSGEGPTFDWHLNLECLTGPHCDVLQLAQVHAGFFYGVGGLWGWMGLWGWGVVRLGGLWGWVGLWGSTNHTQPPTPHPPAFYQSQLTTHTTPTPLPPITPKPPTPHPPAGFSATMAPVGALGFPAPTSLMAFTLN